MIGERRYPCHQANFSLEVSSIHGKKLQEPFEAVLKGWCIILEVHHDKTSMVLAESTEDAPSQIHIGDKMLKRILAIQATARELSRSKPSFR